MTGDQYTMNCVKYNVCYRLAPSGRLRTTGLRACTTPISQFHYFSNRSFCEVKSQVSQVGRELTIIEGDLEAWAPIPGFLSFFKQIILSSLSLPSLPPCRVLCIPGYPTTYYRALVLNSSPCLHLFRVRSWMHTIVHRYIHWLCLP